MINIKKWQALTLLELMIVITALSILAFTGFTNYVRSMEKQRSQRVKMKATLIHSFVEISFAKKGEFPSENCPDLACTSCKGWDLNNLFKDECEIPPEKRQIQYSYNAASKEVTAADTHFNYSWVVNLENPAGSDNPRCSTGDTC